MELRAVKNEMSREAGHVVPLAAVIRALIACWRENLSEGNPVYDGGFPDVASEIRALGREALATGKIPEERCTWGWGADREAPSRSGPLCDSCPARFEQMTLFDGEVA